MSNATAEVFGKRLRELRIGKNITLRKFAQDVGISPTYLSKVERGDFSPPTEDRIKDFAKALGENPDELLAIAGRISSDLTNIIMQHPSEVADLLRTAYMLDVSKGEWIEITNEIKKKKNE
jgi:transcriptional regulator with XRE-family HTH domain